MYSTKLIPAGTPGAKPRLPQPSECPARSAADEWSEESNRQADALARGAHGETDIFAEFRRKLAMGEALSRAVARLAEALRFSGRITVSFHQGRITKTVFEELHIRSPKATGMSP